MLLGVVAGLGWLYLARSIDALAIGPRVPGALPLQQLAGDDDQPLLRIIVAWIPAGATCAVVLDAGTQLSRRARATGVAVTGWLVLVLTGALSDAAAIFASVLGELAAQLGRPGTWTASLLLALGALAPPPRAAPPSRRTPDLTSGAQ